jgi:phosphoribosylaminoimidazole (AIR) synthetase
MCVNDIVCQGAKPLFFLDYYACGRLYPESEADVVKGIAEGCKQAGCALIGGETAEMPGFYPDGEYDLAGFAVGIVDKKKVINGKSIKEGDVLIGLKSTGVHSNGYSLVRKLFGDSDKVALETYDEELGATPAEVLLKPTRIYVKSILALIEKVEVKGIAEGCRQAGCALIGGETAEMPGFYPDGEYDLAGFAVGIVDKKKVINGKNITAGDVLIGLKSTGVHSNGYSLVRKLFGDEDKAALEKYDEELGATVAEVLLKPTKIYVKSILALIEKVEVKGIAHITGGGFIENIPRILPEGVAAEIEKNSYEVPPVFKVMQKRAGITDEQIYNTFNMGIGMVVCVAPENVEAAIESLKATGEDVVVIGKTVAGKGVILK